MRNRQSSPSLYAYLQNQNQKKKLNLEQIIKNERILSQIISIFKSKKDRIQRILERCYSYLTLQKKSPLKEVPFLFNSIELQILIKQSILLERFSIIMLCQLIIRRKFKILKRSFEILMALVKQNFTCLMQLMLLRAPKKSLKNLWILKLKEVIKNNNNIQKAKAQKKFLVLTLRLNLKEIKDKIKYVSQYEGELQALLGIVFSQASRLSVSDIISYV